MSIYTIFMLRATSLTRHSYRTEPKDYAFDLEFFEEVDPEVRTRLRSCDRMSY